MSKGVTILEESREMPSDDAEEYLLTMERLRRFDETRQGVPAAQVRDWLLERRKDPKAPCPLPETTPSR